MLCQKRREKFYINFLVVTPYTGSLELLYITCIDTLPVLSSLFTGPIVKLHAVRLVNCFTVNKNSYTASVKVKNTNCLTVTQGGALKSLSPWVRHCCSLCGVIDSATAAAVADAVADDIDNVFSCYLRTPGTVNNFKPASQMVTLSSLKLCCPISFS